MRKIPGVDAYATLDGLVVSQYGTPMTSRVSKAGYSVTVVKIDGVSKSKSTHRLIAAAYLGLDLDDKTTQVNHIDSVKTNNRVDNLELVNPSQNLLHFYAKKWSHDNDHQIQCRSCMEVKPHEEFGKRQGIRWGRSTTCKVCKDSRLVELGYKKS